MPAAGSERVRKRRDALRSAGLRPVQIWIPDTRQQGFAEECHRQALAAARSDAADSSLLEFMDAVWIDSDDESEPS